MRPKCRFPLRHFTRRWWTFLCCFGSSTLSLSEAKKKISPVVVQYQDKNMFIVEIFRWRRANGEMENGLKTCSAYHASWHNPVLALLAYCDADVDIPAYQCFYRNTVNMAGRNFWIKFPFSRIMGKGRPAKISIYSLQLIERTHAATSCWEFSLVC